MKFIDLFSGVGGFRSGFEEAGFKCAGYVEWDKFARQSYQAMYDTKGEFTDNDIQKTKGIELPEADLWTFGSPCTNVSLAGNRTGIRGKESRMFFEVIRLLKERAENEKTLPTYLVMENVKNLLSSNQGRDFAEVIYQMDKVGYDAEWCVFDSAEVVPQHRERIYIIGHLRERCTREIFPIKRQSGSTVKPRIEIFANSSKTGYKSHDIVSDDGIAKTIDATSYKHVPQVGIHQVGNYLKTNSFGGNPQTGCVYSPNGISPSLNTMQGGNRQPQIVVKACLTPDRLHKRQNGRRFKQKEEPSFTITAADRNGVLLEDGNTVAIRKLTPRECWRLQGFTDEQFDSAQKAGVSDSQLYKQAGNAVTVPVVKAIAENIKRTQVR